VKPRHAHRQGEEGQVQCRLEAMAEKNSRPTVLPREQPVNKPQYANAAAQVFARAAHRTYQTREEGVSPPDERREQPAQAGEAKRASVTLVIRGREEREFANRYVQLRAPVTNHALGAASCQPFVGEP